jgi:hypothetical protein
VIKQHLSRAQIRMKTQADKHMSEASFAVRDWVFLTLQPCVQSSLAPQAHHKLAFRFFGPYKILDKIGTVAYNLDLPAHIALYTQSSMYHCSRSGQVHLYLLPLNYQMLLSCIRFQKKYWPPGRLLKAPSEFLRC